MKNSKVLITVPKLSLPGGVTELFNLLKLNEIKGIQYFPVNMGPKNWGIIFLPIIYLKFIIKIRKVQVVHINPSLDAKSFYRDLILAFISKVIFKRKTIIYWHGWESDFYKKIKNSKFLKNICLKSFGVADTNIILAKKFKEDLICLGFKNNILVENNATTNPIKDLNFTKSINNSNLLNLLFIARICKGKGWDIAIDTMVILNKKGFKHINLTIAGGGECLEEAICKSKNENLTNINFTNHISGELKSKLLQKSNALFFPTFYNEGMPISILEGMMHGLPIISRNVGGIPDHIIHGVNGFLTDSLNPEIFADFIIKINNNPNLYNSMRNNNILYAKENFTPERLRENLLKLYN